MGNFIKFLAENWKAIVALIGAIIVASTLTTVVVSHYKDNVHKEFLKRHDEELAQKLTDEFVQRMNNFQKQVNIEKQDLIAKIKDLCAEYKLSTSLVLKPQYV